MPQGHERNYDFMRLMTQKHLQLLDELHERELDSITQKVYSRFAFFVNIRTLSDEGYVEVSRETKTKRKFWKLTPFGKKFIESLRMVDNLWLENQNRLY